MSKQLNIVIEGDFINSFIYSGVLFLVNSELVLKAYPWDRIFDDSLSDLTFLEKHRLEEYSKGKSSSVHSSLKRTYSISKEKLSNFELCSKELKVWPSDVNIYKNRFYVASEFGVDALDFNWDKGSISKFSVVNRIFDEVSFKLATNTHYRLAVAAGKSGVVSIVPDIKMVKKTDINQIISDTCVDCQWQNNHLIANTENGHSTASFLNIPKQSDFDGSKDEYWKSVSIIKKTPPKIDSVDMISESKIVSSWFVGNKVFKLTENKRLFSCDMKLPNQVEEIELNSELSTLQYFQAQSSPFGTIMESGESLLFFGEEKAYTIDDDVVNWRLFPKSTYYLNHLHVIKDDYLSVRLFDMFDNTEMNKFGYSKKLKSED